MIAETERLLLRELCDADYEDMVRVFSSFQNAAGFPNFRGHVYDWLTRYLDHQKRHGYGMYAVVLKKDRTLIGDCGLEFCRGMGGTPEVEITYEYDRAYWGQGYATEAAMAVRDYAFGLLGLTRITSFISEDQTAAMRVIEKIGLVAERKIAKDGQPLFLYAMNRPSSSETKASH